MTHEEWARAFAMNVEFYGDNLDQRSACLLDYIRAAVAEERAACAALMRSIPDDRQSEAYAAAIEARGSDVR